MVQMSPNHLIVWLLLLVPSCLGNASENGYRARMGWEATRCSWPDPTGWVAFRSRGPSAFATFGLLRVNDGLLHAGQDVSTTAPWDLIASLPSARDKDWREVRDELGDRFIGRLKNPC